MYSWPESSNPASMRAQRREPTARWPPRATAPWASSTTSITAPTGVRTTTPTPLAVAVAEAGRGRRPDRGAAPGRVPPGRLGRAPTSAHSRQRRFAILRLRTSWRARMPCVNGPRPSAHAGWRGGAQRPRVPAEWLTAIAEYTDLHGLVRHVHAAGAAPRAVRVRAEHGCSPVSCSNAPASWASARAWCTDPRVAPDIELLAQSRTIVVSCPTTEGNLGDGHLRRCANRDAEVRLAIGSDSQVRLDPFEEARELETGARRRARRATACWRRPVTSGASSCATGSEPGPRGRRGGLADGGPRAPDLAGVADKDLKLALSTCSSAGVVVGSRGLAPPAPADSWPLPAASALSPSVIFGASGADISWRAMRDEDGGLPLRLLTRNRRVRPNGEP